MANDNSDINDETSRDHDTATKSASSTFANLKDAIPTSTEELKAQLAEAKAMIARLTSGNQQEGGEVAGALRQRKGNLAESAKDVKDNVTGNLKTMTAQAKQNAPSAGVAVPTVAVLCLLSFLLAYFFF